MPHPESEVWLLVCYNGRANRVIEEHKKKLTFDPRKKPEKLTSTSGMPERDVKVIWKSVTDQDEQAADNALSATLSVLKSAAPSSGLPAFIEQIEKKLEPWWASLRGGAV